MGSAPVTRNLGKGPFVFSRYPISHPKVYYMAWCHTHLFEWWHKCSEVRAALASFLSSIHMLTVPPDDSQMSCGSMLSCWAFIWRPSHGGSLGLLEHPTDLSTGSSTGIQLGSLEQALGYGQRLTDKALDSACIVLVGVETKASREINTYTLIAGTGGSGPSD